jgi:hypothetical protein
MNYPHDPMRRDIPVELPSGVDAGAVDCAVVLPLAVDDARLGSDAVVLPEDKLASSGRFDCCHWTATRCIRNATEVRVDVPIDVANKPAPKSKAVIAPEVRL